MAEVLSYIVLDDRTLFQYKDGKIDAAIGSNQIDDRWIRVQIDAKFILWEARFDNNDDSVSERIDRINGMMHLRVKIASRKIDSQRDGKCGVVAPKMVSAESLLRLH